MEKIKAKQLFKRYNEGNASKEEAKLLEHWYANQSAIEQQKPENVDYLQVNEEMWLNIQKNKNKAKKVSLWPSIAVASAIVMCLGFATYFYQKSNSVNVSKELTVQDIMPGKNSSTLTLASGKQIFLTDLKDGKIKNDSGVDIANTADGKLIFENKTGSDTQHSINTLTTSKGQQFQLILPDGTKVWLNAQSSLKFPTSFINQETRVVELVGQAYFEVSKIKKQPFIVSTNKQQVKVLGTHFDVNSYEDDAITKTTLLEGSVEITALLNQSKSILKPNQQALLNNQSLTVQQVNAETAIAWKNGFFEFENDDIKTVMNQISRWYDIDVKYSGKIPQERFNGKVYRNMSLAKMLEILSFSQINFKLEGRTMIITTTDNK